MPKSKKTANVETLVPASAPVAETAASQPEVIQSETAANKNAQLPVTMSDSVLKPAFEGWSKSEVRDAQTTVRFAIENMVKAAECKMEVGTRFNKFAAEHGDEKTNVLIRATAKLGIAGLSEGNIALWRIRATEILKYFPNERVRRQVLAFTGGEGIIVRDESFDEKNPDGTSKPKPYILSPAFQAALKDVPVSTTTDEEVAEMNARKIVAAAKQHRSNAQTAPFATRFAAKCKSFRALCKAALEKDSGSYEKDVYQQLRLIMREVVSNTTDLGLAGQLASFINDAADGKAGMNGEFSEKHTPASKQPGTRVGQIA